MFFVGAVEVGDGEHEVIDGFARCDAVERDDAGRGDVVDVARLLADAVRQHVQRELGRVDQRIAPAPEAYTG